MSDQGAEQAARRGWATSASKKTADSAGDGGAAALHDIDAIRTDRNLRARARLAGMRGDQKAKAAVARWDTEQAAARQSATESFDDETLAGLLRATLDDIETRLSNTNPDDAGSAA